MNVGFNSFSVGEVGWRRGLLILFLAIVVFSAPVAVLIWYLHGGGHAWEMKRRLHKLVQRDPVSDAVLAAGEGDLRMITVGSYWDRRVPGFGFPQDSYAKKHGYRHVQTYHGDTLTAEENSLNEEVAEYAHVYNSRICSLLAPARQERHVQNQQE